MMLKACRVAHTAASIHTAFCIYMREEPDSLLSSSPSETNIQNHQIRFFLSSTLQILKVLDVILGKSCFFFFFKQSKYDYTTE